MRWRVLVQVALLLFVTLAPASAQTLPSPSDWKQHFERDILPFWQTPAALGSPVGNFPTFRCNDGSVYNPQAPCAEIATAADWIKSAAGRQYVRMMSRQVYLYGVAFHLTGDAKYLGWASAGAHYIVDHAFDAKTGGMISYWEGGKAIAEAPDQTSQDLAYTLIGLSFYYYLTRDPYVLQPILRVEHYIRQNFLDPKLGLYRLKRPGPEGDRLELVSQLDQVNAYMLLMTPLLPPPEQLQWRTELAQIVQIIRKRFYDPGSGMFLGTLAQKPTTNCIYQRDDTDFGHTIKTYWMLYFTGQVLRDKELEAFARDKAAAIFQRAFLPDTGSWATQPTCDGKLNRTSTWWMAAELDQAALTLGMANPRLLKYLPATFDFWLKRMVDHTYGEVWDELTVPEYKPQRPKIHLWKNGFHTAEHVLVGYITTSAIQSQPLVLYYAFPDCKLPSVVRPYYFDASIGAQEPSPAQAISGLCPVKVTFGNIH